MLGCSNEPEGNRFRITGGQVNLYNQDFSDNTLTLSKFQVDSSQKLGDMDICLCDAVFGVTLELEYYFDGKNDEPKVNGIDGMEDSLIGISYAWYDKVKDTIVNQLNHNFAGIGKSHQLVFDGIEPLNDNFEEQDGIIKAKGFEYDYDFIDAINQFEDDPFKLEQEFFFYNYLGKWGPGYTALTNPDVVLILNLHFLGKNGEYTITLDGNK